jgi:hypothetical protein
MCVRDGKDHAVANAERKRSGCTEQKGNSELGDTSESGELLSFYAVEFTEFFVPDAE